MLGESIGECAGQYLVFSRGLNPIIHQQNHKRQHAAPLADHECRPRNPQQNARINRMTEARVWSSADKLMINLEDDFVAPVLSEMNSGPERQHHSANSKYEPGITENRVPWPEPTTQRTNRRPSCEKQSECDC